MSVDVVVYQDSVCIYQICFHFLLQTDYDLIMGVNLLPPILLSLKKSAFFHAGRDKMLIHLPQTWTADVSHPKSPNFLQLLQPATSLDDSA